ncbi:unnamed protein product [Malus baccata var. baccata]
MVLKVALNKLEQTMGLLFSSLDVLFLDFNISLGVVMTDTLDGATTSTCHQLGLVRYFLDGVCQSISFNQMIFLMVPGPPFPSRISACLIAWGAILGMRLSASRTKALNNLDGGISEVNSFSNVQTPMMIKKKVGK